MLGKASMKWTSISGPLRSSAICLPAPTGLLSVWQNLRGPANCVGALVGTSKDLKRFPAYLQQLTMEQRQACGTWQMRRTGADLLGASPGPTASIPFYQLIHQGTCGSLHFIAFAHTLNLFP